jgi:Ca2+-binding EF-hand superfamily protein
MIQDRDPHEDLQRAFKLFTDESSNTINYRNLRKISK